MLSKIMLRNTGLQKALGALEKSLLLFCFCRKFTQQRKAQSIFAVTVMKIIVQDMEKGNNIGLVYLLLG